MDNEPVAPDGEAGGASEVDPSLTADDIREELGNNIGEVESESVLRFDPFAGNVEEQAAAGTVAPVAPVEETAQPAVVEPTAPDNAAQVAGLITELAELRGQVSAFASTQGAPTAEPTAPVPDDIDIPAYNVGVPDALVEGLASEDPQVRKNSIAGMLSGIGALVHKEVKRDMLAVIQQSVPRIAAETQSSTRTQEAIFNDFYGNYPQLNVPELRGVIQNAAGPIFQEMGLTAANFGSKWPAARAALGTKVLGLLNLTQPQTAPALQPRVPGGTGASPTTASPRVSVEQDILNLF